MAEFLINKNHNWMNDLTQEQIDARTVLNPAFMDKYEVRKTPGDIVCVEPDGFWDQATDWGSHAYYLVKVPGVSVEKAKEYLKSLMRNVSFQRTLNNTEQHIYEYTVVVEEIGTRGIELFKARDLIHKLPDDISVVSKSPTQAVLRFEPLKHDAVISGEQTVEKRKEIVETMGKEMLSDLTKSLRKFRCRVKLNDLPQVIKDRLANNEAITVTPAQFVNYAEDKGLI